MSRTKKRNPRLGPVRPAWPARPAAARLRRARATAHSRSAADPSDPGLHPSLIGRPNRQEYACIAKAESVRNKKGHWLVLTRSPVAGFNPIRDIKSGKCTREIVSWLWPSDRGRGIGVGNRLALTAGVPALQRRNILFF